MDEPRKTLDAVIVAKSDDEKRLATVVYSVVTDADGKPVVDSQGDVIAIDDLEAADIEAFANGGLGRGGEQHERMGVADVVQHFTLNAAQREALGFGRGPEMGIAKLYVRDDSTWQRIKSGELRDVSIGGSGIREAIDG